MKYILLNLVILSILSSCSSDSKKLTPEQAAQNDAISPEIQQEFNWIENADFTEVAPEPYIATEDKFEGSISNQDSLSQESIARLPAPKIEDAIDSNDITTKLAGLCHANRFNDAFLLVKKQFRKFKKHPGFWNQVGTCYLGKKDYRSAILFYNKSREIDSKYSPPLNNLGVIYQIRGSKAKAYLAYKEASKLNPLSLTPLFNLAQLQLQGGQVDNAIVAFQALVKKNDDDVDALAGFATALFIRGETEQSIRVFDRLSGDALANPSYGTNYALALKLGGKEDKAREILSRVSSTPSRELIDYYNKVKAFVYQGGNQ